ncbi:NAD(P)-dependent oxidoreductase [Nonomuraea sp. NBC_01738]|uniref:NAD-dependent epimerase/dehydratase family protein n=1 Tax=Nonomuraea sp. NBC_01738 TaxID=2976003 RepID=UPI002E120973|nr:NAD(P)-dependent oxidoreductase [Nonomuraea sp. NBC_01738]
MTTIVVTGAAGRVGRAVRAALREVAGRLVLVDRVPLTAEDPVEAVRQADLTSLDDVREIVAGAGTVVHLAGIPDEAPMADLLLANVLGTQQVLEAARLEGVGRVVLAGSNRMTGYYPVKRTLGPDVAARPDGLYGASKAAVEAVARVYADKFGLEVVSLRIGSLEDEPQNARHLATWLSPRDCAGFFADAVTGDYPGFTAAYAVSANTRRFWELTAGYTPVDDAEAFAGRFDGIDEYFADGVPQGGEFAGPGYTLRNGRLTASS